MSIVILSANQGDATYCKACEEFKALYQKVTGNNIDIIDIDDEVSDLIVIGSDAVNDFVMNEVLELRLKKLGIRYGTDDYCIKSHMNNDRKILILAGGRGRSTLYAVYDYFERFLGCHYFWDGDVIPHNDSIPLENIDVVESPRFEYRGLRYFAHRGLKRFQAEHWSFEDWKKEIDWMLKKRLNIFMLRIGMDDIWQRTFPEDVPYPDGYNTITGVDASGYNDRTDFWTLEYRGKLREKILEYARLVDLMCPVDCGTMTHWYSRTPIDFLKNKKPRFITQEVEKYTASDTGCVFDFTTKENMDYYMKLTETMVNEFEKNTSLFHTIGLGEREMFKDKNKNFALKLIAYRRIGENIRRRYPNSKLMIASWDFIGWWAPEEVQSLIDELDPEHTIIFDYTSDSSDPENCFLKWGVVGKFPWIFGLFHAYEPDSELRGSYDKINARLKVACEDPYCKGMVLWPELSHSDPIILEYLSQNSWTPLCKNVEDMIAGFCANRYGNFAEHMNSSWQQMLPFIKCGDWGGYSHRTPDDVDFYEHFCGSYTHCDLWTRPLYASKYISKNIEQYSKFYEHKAKKIKPTIDGVVCAIKNLSQSSEALKETFVLRDAVDMTRTALGRVLNYILIKTLTSFGDEEKTLTLKNYYFEALDIMEKLLSLNSDFSMYKTIEHLRVTAPTNPDFENTLKRNVCNFYCYQPVYEVVRGLLKDKANVLYTWIIEEKADPNIDLIARQGELYSNFERIPLKDLQPESIPQSNDIISKAAELIETVKDIIF